MKPTGKHAIVIGGSLGGLFTGIMLRSIRWEVDIYERSPHSYVIMLTCLSKYFY